MVHPDQQLLRPVLRVRYAIIFTMLIAYSIAWVLMTMTVIPRATQYAVITAILGAQATLGLALHWTLAPRYISLLVHLNLIIDTLATSGMILCTGYAGSPFPLFYILIVLAAGLLYGRSIGMGYLFAVSVANAAVLYIDQVYPVDLRRFPLERIPFVIMGAALPVVAFQMLLVVRLTQRGRYLQVLYENVSDGLLVLDADGWIVDLNRQASRMSGRRRAELLGMRLDQLAASADGSGLIAEQIRRCLLGESVFFEVLLRGPRGEPLPVEISAQKVIGLSPTRIQAFARDISARRRMEEEIRRQNEQLRRINQELQTGRDLALNASRLKSQFLANMSHELRTPLNSIMGYTQFVLQDPEHPLNEDQREDLGRVLEAARHLLELINGLLDLARIESGRESVTVSRFRLQELAESVLDSVAPMAKQKGLELHCAADRNLPELESDEKKLRQVLLNLAANAVKFTERGSVHIECKGNDHRTVSIVVRDTGIGIPADRLDEIFSEFHQIDPSIHKRYGGSGLGLAIAKRLLELLGGTIGVESRLGEGSTFTVTLPVRLEGKRAERAPPQQAEATG